MSKDLTIKILAHDIKVTFESPGDWDGCGMGRADLIAQTIKINNILKADARNVTLIHEILHLISDMNSMDLTESQVSILATSLYTVVKENSELISFKFKRRV